MASDKGFFAEGAAASETGITEITIAKDGRIYVFGLSKEVLGILAEMCPDNLALQERASRLPNRASAEEAGRASARISK